MVVYLQFYFHFLIHIYTLLEYYEIIKFLFVIYIIVYKRLVICSCVLKEIILIHRNELAFLQNYHFAFIS